MKKLITITTALCALALCLTACRYKAPLQENTGIKLDDRLIGKGVWKLKENGQNAETMNILKFSETEYLVQYSSKTDVAEAQLIYRAYPIQIGDIDCIQLQLIGTNEGSLDKKNATIYDVYKYKVDNDVLEIMRLNEKVVGKNLETTEELQKAFLNHKDHDDLFVDPKRFKKD